VETKVDYNAKAFAGFDLDKDFGRLQAQAEALAGMQSFDPQKIAVILRPGALQELLWFMGWMMNRRQSDEGFTPYTGQLGKPFFGEKFSWYSTLKRPEMVASPYNGEGVVSVELPWVENGVTKKHDLPAGIGQKKLPEHLAASITCSFPVVRPAKPK